MIYPYFPFFPLPHIGNWKMKEGNWVIDKKTGEIGRIIGIDGEYAIIGRYNYQGKTKMKLDDLHEFVYSETYG